MVPTCAAVNGPSRMLAGTPQATPAQAGRRATSNLELDTEVE